MAKRTLGGRAPSARPPPGHARCHRAPARPTADSARRFGVSGKRTLIAGGTVATDYGVFPADVLIEDERIVSIADHGSLNEADDVIDAAGLVVMPGAEPAYPHVTDAQFLAGMCEVEAIGGLVLVHAENDSLLQAGLARMQAEGRHDPLAHHESRPPFIEEEAVHRALFLAAEAGVRIQIVHVSSPVSAELVRRSKAEGQAASMEICPHHLLLDLDDLVRLGPYGRCAPA